MFLKHKKRPPCFVSIMHFAIACELNVIVTSELKNHITVFEKIIRIP